MSRELLKRALEVIDQAEIYAENENKALALYRAIETYLAQPEPEPVAWVSDRGTIWHDKHDAVDDSDGFIQALYTSQPDQSARIAELEGHLEAAEQHVKILRQQLAALQAKREPLSDLRILNIAEVVDGKTRTREDLFVDFARAIEAAHGITP